MWVNPLADATAEAMRGSLETARQSGRFLYLVAASPDTDAYLGEILLFRRTDEVAEVAIGEVAYVVAPTARGRGLATAAVRMVSRWALGDLGLARLQISVHPDNTPSLRVAERAGYVREGMVRSLKLIRGVRSTPSAIRCCTATWTTRERVDAKLQLVTNPVDRPHGLRRPALTRALAVHAALNCPCLAFENGPG
jgi:RimJ/RimL family protein N-acetyltransferase